MAGFLRSRIGNRLKRLSGRWRRGGVSQWGLGWRRLKKNRAAIAGLIIVGVIGVMAIFDRQIALFPPKYIPPLCMVGSSSQCPNPPFEPRAPPSFQHPFGTDFQGYDVYSQIVYGAKAAFLVGIGATAIAIAIAVLIGLVAGYFGGWIDNVLMRLTEVFLVLPFLLILIVFLRVFATKFPTGTAGLWIIIAIIGIFSWSGAARIIRGEVLHVREYEYVAAARQIGASGSRILFRHLFPNVLHVVIVLATLQISGSILTEAAVSFLGFGDTNSITWGQQLTNASSAVKEAWWSGAFPGIFVTLLVMGFNLLGNGLRDALDPRLRE